MKMKMIAGFAFLLNTILFATYYAVAKEALIRIDPIVFTFFEMTTLAPVGLGILAFTWQRMTWALVKRGVLLGSCLCLALFTIAIALKYSTATGTAFFPALNGFLAALIAWLVFRQPMNKATWFAGILSVVGAGLLMANSQMGGVRGIVIAFLGGLFFTGYVFLSDHGQKGSEKQEKIVHWPLFGVELLTMAVWACLVALLFGDWQAFHPSFPKDALVILYIAGACTFLPTLIAVVMQKHVSVVTVSFIYILEPVLGAIIANFYLHEVLPLDGYLGGSLVVVGAFVHTWGSVEHAEQPAQEPVQKRRVRMYQQFATALFSSYLFPMLCCCAGFLILYELGGFPPLAWRELYQRVPALMGALQPGHEVTASSLLVALQQGTQREFFLLLIAQAICWLIGWGTLAVIVCITISHIWTRGRTTRVRRGGGAGAMGAGTLAVAQGGRNHEWSWQYPQQGRPQGSKVPTPIRSATPTPTNTGGAIWGGPLKRPALEGTPLHEYYDIQDVMTQGLPIVTTIPLRPLSIWNSRKGEG